MTGPTPVPHYTRLDDREAVETLLQHVRAGVNLTTSLKMARISRAAFYDWLSTASEAVEPCSVHERKCVEFADAVDRAHHQAISSLELVMARAARTDWRAAEKFLKRLHPERWGDKVNVEHAGEVAVRAVTPPPPNMHDPAEAQPIIEARALMGDRAACIVVASGDFSADSIRVAQEAVEAGTAGPARFPKHLG